MYTLKRTVQSSLGQQRVLSHSVHRATNYRVTVHMSLANKQLNYKKLAVSFLLIPSATPTQPDFKEEVGIETTEVFKGGSMGQGTRVTGYYDIDLVLYSRGEQARQSRPKW